MKKIINLSLVVSLALMSILYGSSTTVSAQDREPISVGILQFNAHGSLDENYRGFIEGLAELGYVEGENLTVNYVNAAAEVSQLPSLASSIEAESD